jgi:hypothetical protein
VTEQSDEALDDAGGIISFSPPLRLHHLTGGIGFLLGNNEQGMILAPCSEGLRPIIVERGMSVQEVMSDYCGIRVLGRTTAEQADNLKDPVTDNFIISARNARNTCLAADQSHHWSGVALALQQKQKFAEAALASRIASQIDFCTRRLERLSIAYRTVLSIVGYGKMNAPHSITSNKYAQHIGTEYRSLLSELYGLRDAVNAAAYRLKYHCDDRFETKKLKSKVLGDSTPLGLLVAASMFREGDDLLILRMSLYRSVGQHSLGTNSPLFSDCYQLRQQRGRHGSVGYLVFPLYDDLEIMREVEAGRPMLFDELRKKEAERFLSKDDHLDGLEFSYDCFVRLLSIASLLASDIGLLPKRFTITDADILNATFTDETGKVTRLKRDPETGKLVEY